MVETVNGTSGTDGVAAAARLLHDFNVEYDDPTPTPQELATRLAQLILGDHITVLLACEHETGTAVGVAVMRVQPSMWSVAQEAYLAELYVVPSQRGQGYGRELITEAIHTARERGADYAFVITTEEDRLPQRLYQAAGFRRTEGDDGPVVLAYERELQSASVSVIPSERAACLSVLRPRAHPHTRSPRSVEPVRRTLGPSRALRPRPRPARGVGQLRCGYRGRHASGRYRPARAPATRRVPRPDQPSSGPPRP